MGVPENKYFSVDEAIGLLGVKVLMRPEIADADLSSAGLLMAMAAVTRPLEADGPLGAVRPDGHL